MQTISIGIRFNQSRFKKEKGDLGNFIQIVDLLSDLNTNKIRLNIGYPKFYFECQEDLTDLNQDKLKINIYGYLYTMTFAESNNDLNSNTIHLSRALDSEIKRN